MCKTVGNVWASTRHHQWPPSFLALASWLEFTHVTKWVHFHIAQHHIVTICSQEAGPKRRWRRRPSALGSLGFGNGSLGGLGPWRFRGLRHKTSTFRTPHVNLMPKVLFLIYLHKRELLNDLGASGKPHSHLPSFVWLRSTDQYIICQVN